MPQSQVLPVSEPLYEQVYRIFRTRIMSGEWQPRSLLPGEVLLSHQLGVSVGTVRKAMDQLARENLVLRKRGRGTFVRGGEEWQDAKGLKLFDRAGRLIAPAVELVDARLGKATAIEAKSLHIEASRRSEARVLRISRQWRSGELMVNREEIVVEASRLPELVVAVGQGRAETNSVYAETVLERIDRTVWSIGNKADWEAAPAECASDVRLDKAGSVLYLGSLSLDARGVPIELGRHEIQLDNCVLQLNG